MTESKAQRFALEAETFADWDVKRKRDGERRIVIARRGVEAFRFEWEPGERGQKMVKGRHAVGDLAEDYTNVKGALRIMSQPAGKVSISPPARRGRPRKITTESDAPIRVRRIPFDPDKDDDLKILTVCADKQITWINHLSGNEEKGFTPRGGLHYFINHLEGKRILNFADTSGIGFRSVDIKAIVGVR